MSPAPLISIILIVWNSSVHLPRCLLSLRKQTNRNFEIIIVDNGSIDGSVDDVEKEWGDLLLTVERRKTNLGFAVANNIGSRLARGKWVIMLNADAFPEPCWLENLLTSADQNPEYTAFSSRQLKFDSPNVLDGAGDAYHISGLAWRNSYNLPADQNGLEEREIFSPCAAAAMYLREQFLSVGGFDEDYFSYFEDVDLGFRLRLNGAKCLYVPGAVVHHVGSASTGKRSDFSVYYGYRNMIWTFFKNMPNPYFWLFLPLHVLSLLFFVFYLTLRGQGKVIGKAILDAMRGLPTVLAKRKVIQENKKIASNEIIKFMSTGIFEPYIEFVRRNRIK